ncbi:MAG: TIGR03960 family B12-binding radical SAM protein [Spirochaetia bacterium]|nr:TIGR03960 family B12-binding radical SAM protein [Spirochaetia bacterium]
MDPGFTIERAPARGNTTHGSASPTVDRAAPFAPQIEYLSREELIPLWQKSEKPGRYAGGEFGITEKDPARASARLLLSYPDTYELGMSNQGLKILYDAVNRRDDLYADRTFLPWPDFGRLLTEARLPLYSLDRFLSARSFDVWGFNVAHELHFTNILYAMELAGISLLRTERGAYEPLIICGGTSVSNPLPLFDFVDGIFMGDGEEGILEILEIVARERARGATRQEVLEALSSVESLVLPHLYTPTYNGGEASYAGPLVQKRTYRAKEFAVLEHIVIPNVQITQDRVVLEVARGCGQGCRFCHAGFWKRPVRNSEVASLVENAGRMLARTGGDSLSLHALSIADYPWLEELVVELANKYGPNGVSLSLPSLRVQVKTIPVLEMTSNIRRSSITFALEAGSELMRERIHKKSSEENLHYLVRQVYSRGWELVKVYFMAGLPDRDGTETEDLIRALHALDAIARECGPRKHVNVSISLFVPKPFTTFQWEKQATPEYFETAIRRIKSELKSKRVHLKHPNPWMAYVEGLLSRSDDRVGRYLLDAYRNGARFDSWDDLFAKEVWIRVIEEIPAELKRAWLEQKPGGAKVPWEDVVEGMPREKLVRDFEKFEAVTTENMSPPRAQALKESDFPAELLKPVHIPEHKCLTAAYARIKYAKEGSFLFVSHLDTAEVIRKAARRAGLPMTFTQGFNKHEKIRLDDSLPLFFASEGESAVLELYAPVNEKEAGAALAKALPAGLRLVAFDVTEEAPRREMGRSKYTLMFRDPAIAEKTQALMESLPDTAAYERIERKKKRLHAGAPKMRTVSRTVKPAVHNVKRAENQITFEIDPSDGGAVSVKDLLSRFLELPYELWNTQVVVTRSADKTQE